MAAAAYDLTEKSVRDLQEAMSSGQVSSVQLVQSYLDRIAAYDQQGPSLNAVLYINPLALRSAEALDKERAARGPRGLLHGIPVLLKDNYDTYDMPTTGASIALSHAQPRQDAFQVARLRSAGCVFLGKLNLHELALGLTTHSSLGGQTLNPYCLERSPGGSSGGSGAATAANFAAFTMGSDTSGSIRMPSSHNNIVGLRPTAGLSSRSGIIPFSHTQDTGGPMARTVSDIAIVLDATVGYDPADPVTVNSRGKTPATYMTSLGLNALRGARIGVLNAFFGEEPEDREVSNVVRAALEDMRHLGARLVDVAIPDTASLIAASNVMSQELKFYLGAYLQETPGTSVKSIEELLASGLLSNTVQRYLTHVFDVAAQPNDYLTSDDYRGRLQARETLSAAILEVMDGNRLDAIAYPIACRIAPLLGGNQTGSNASLSAQSGFPEISVPAGFTPAGFPVGMDLLGQPFSEPTLLGLAYAFEQATHHRQPPGETLLHGAPPPSIPTAGSSDTGPGSVTALLRATGKQSSPPSDVSFEASIRLSFSASTRQLGYDITLEGATVGQVAGVYLHRREIGPNGGVSYLLAKAGRPHISGRVTLLEAEAADLRDGKCYVSLLSSANPLLSARADINLPVS